ncbi:MAG TPA: hypothetical protein VK791_08835 [bacterium]|nr:hypothetical protein [bacterium]
MALTHEQILRRLAFIKYLFGLANDQVVSPHPLNAVSILTMHDSVELFLELAARHLDVEKPNKQEIFFIQYFELINKKMTEVKLSRQIDIGRLNKQRVGLKHDGIIPSESDIKEDHEIVISFFRENCKEVFGVEFNDVSMTHLVMDEESRESLVIGKGFITKGMYEDAQSSIAVSFRQLIDNYMNLNRKNFHQTPLDFGPSFNFVKLHEIPRLAKDDMQVRNFLTDLVDAVESLQNAMKINGLGLDFNKYLKFKFLTPHVNKTADGKFHTIFGDPRKEHEFTKDDCDFCFDFIIESALKLQTFKFLN